MNARLSSLLVAGGVVLAGIQSGSLNGALPDAGAAATVVDVQRLPEHLADLRGHQARQDIGGAASRIGHDHAHGALRILLRPRWRCKQGAGRPGAHSDHDGPSAGLGHGLLS